LLKEENNELALPSPSLEMLKKQIVKLAAQFRFNHYVMVHFGQF